MRPIIALGFRAEEKCNTIATGTFDHLSGLQGHRQAWVGCSYTSTWVRKRGQTLLIPNPEIRPCWVSSVYKSPVRARSGEVAVVCPSLQV